MIVFPYKKGLLQEYYPIVDLTLRLKDKISQTTALIDSGASISIFRPEVAESLKLAITKGREISLGGVGGRIKGYIHHLVFEIAGKQISAPVVFSYQYSVSLNLLGREGVFKEFRIIFEEKDLRVKFEET